MNERSIWFQGFSPILSVTDLDRELACYVEQLGFAVTWRWEEPAGDG